DWSRNDVSLAGGRFVTNLARLRLSWSLTPRFYLQALLQYNDRIDNWSTNLRLGFIQTANSGLFLVYNENRETETGLPIRDRSITLKISRLFDLLD
ncbi:MAG TPA: hydrolase, partial [Vicinamibacteria bacterium]